jgi:hypothetical protein
MGRVSQLLDEMTAQDRFRRAALSGDVLVPAMMKSLSRSIPAAVTIESLAFRREEGVVLLKGRVQASAQGEVKVLAQFISDLSASPFFREATLVNTGQDPQHGASKFEIRCITESVV